MHNALCTFIKLLRPKVLFLIEGLHFEAALIGGIGRLSRARASPGGNLCRNPNRSSRLFFPPGRRNDSRYYPLFVYTGIFLPLFSRPGTTGDRNIGRYLTGSYKPNERFTDGTGKICFPPSKYRANENLFLHCPRQANHS